MSSVVAHAAPCAAGGSRRRARGRTPGPARPVADRRRRRGQAAEPGARRRGAAGSRPSGTVDARRFELGAESYRPVADRQPRRRSPQPPGGAGQRLRGRARPAPATRSPPRQAATNASPRRASRTASTRAARRRRRAERPAPPASRPAASSAPVACASARAVATPIRRPVNDPGPDADADALDVGPAQRRPPRAPPRPAASRRAACPGRSPGGRVVAALDAARPSGGASADDGRRRGGVEAEHRPAAHRRDLDLGAGRRRRARSVHARRRCASRRELGLGDLGPLDEGDRGRAST